MKIDAMRELISYWVDNDMISDTEDFPILCPHSYILFPTSVILVVYSKDSIEDWEE